MLTIETIAGRKLSNWIDGRWQEPVTRRWIPSFDPFTSQPWHEVADSGVQDVDAALAAAQRALRPWRAFHPADRARMLSRLGRLIADNADALARIEVRDNGKLLREMRAQIGILAEQFDYFAGAADKMEGSTIPLNRRDVLAYTVREPLGVVAIITPWNSPLYQLSWTLGPALAMGNTVVAKPSEHTSASALAIGELAREAGIPDGVYNVVTGLGTGAGDALTSDPRVAKVAFTGSTATGRKVAHSAAEHFAQCNLELGGKSPNCVFDDAPFDRALNGVVAGIFAAGGQTCVAGSRIYVQRGIYSRFLEALAERAAAIELGDPCASSTQMGPIAVEAQLTKVAGMVARAVEDGAQLISGGRRPGGALASGWFYEPTLLAGADQRAQIVQDEVFGPVAVVMPFDDERELFTLANDSRYGLTAGIWTQDLDRAMHFARQVEAGTIWVNTYRAASYTTPMGGFKESGYGKHYGLESLREYSRIKSVMVDFSGSTPDAFVMRVKDTA